MRFQHTHRPVFLFGLIDLCTAGLFFLFYLLLNGVGALVLLVKGAFAFCNYSHDNVVNEP